MPLVKRTLNENAKAASSTVTESVIAQSQEVTSAQAEVAKTAAKARAAKAGASAPLTKESYWERKEERDIETGKRIRRSGVWQAALQSMGSLQFNQGGTLDSFLDLVDKIADRGLGYVNKD